MPEQENKSEVDANDPLTTPPPAAEHKKSEKPEKAEKGVSKKEFSEFQSQVTGALGAIMEKLDKAPQVVADSAGIHVAKTPIEGGPGGQSMVPPAWRALADEILGAEFEIELELPENGGQKFSVYVPLDKSNAHSDYKAAFGRDKRTRELGNTGIKGVKDWLLKVRRNLVSSGIKLPYYEDSQPQLISTR
jgi:hypothetical protein